VPPRCGLQPARPAYLVWEVRRGRGGPPGHLLLQRNLRLPVLQHPRGLAGLWWVGRAHCVHGCVPPTPTPTHPPWRVHRTYCEHPPTTTTTTITHTPTHIPPSPLSMPGKRCDFQLLSGSAYGNLTTFRDKMPQHSSTRDWSKVYWGVGIGGGVLVLCLLCVGGLEYARWSRFKKAVKELTGEPDAKEVRGPVVVCQPPIPHPGPCTRPHSLPPTAHPLYFAPLLCVLQLKRLQREEAAAAAALTSQGHRSSRAPSLVRDRDSETPPSRITSPAGGRVSRATSLLSTHTAHTQMHSVMPEGGDPMSPTVRRR
jgi:hypothetical protein